MKFRTAAAGSFAALIFLAGCSSDSDEAATTETTTSAPAEETATEAPMAEAGTIVEVASANPDFSTLVAAVDAADLVQTLSGEGPFTVFAPTNAAFEALPEGVLEALLLPENKDALTAILTYHVVPDEVTSDEVKDGDVTTVEGSTLAVAIEDNQVKLNDSATVVAVDVGASNGVIHVIDAVLVPPTVDVAALTS